MGSGWRLRALVPRFLKEPVERRAKEEGLSTSAWVGAVLANAIGYEEAVRDLRPWWAVDRARIEEPLKLLERAKR